MIEIKAPNMQRPNTKRLRAIYRIRADAADIRARAAALAVEQSVEMPLSAIRDQRVTDEVVAQVVAIDPAGTHDFRVTIDHALEAVTDDIAQIMNMLFGNSSLHDDVMLEDVILPPALDRTFPGPRFGIDGLRKMTGATGRALTASALKPIGLGAEDLAELAHAMALGGIDIIKDDHGLAEQVRAPFAARVPAVASAIAKANRTTGGATLYAPSVSGDLDAIRNQITIARTSGVKAVLIAPMVIGLPALRRLRDEAHDLALIAHPALGGAQRIAAPLLIGKLFRALGADATVFPNFGGRFSYSRALCLAIASAARDEDGTRLASLPMPAGGMTLDRVPELLDAYGSDCALLIGGALLAEGANLTSAAKALSERVKRHGQV